MDLENMWTATSSTTGKIRNESNITKYCRIKQKDLCPIPTNSKIAKIVKY